MFGNYIRGGQIFLHKMRMLKQVWEKTLLTSFVVGLFITGYFSYEKLSKLDYAAGITYVKAEIAVSIDKILSNKKPSTISVITSSGIHNKMVKAKDVLTHPGIKRRYNEIFETYLRTALLQFWIMLGLFISIILIWTKSGKTADEKSVTKGGKVLSAEEVSKILKKLDKVSDFKIGGMPLVKDKETSHILITGTTGSGKSNCMHQLLPQIRKKNQSAVVVDFTGEMLARYYDPKRGDIIINPYDEKAHSWDFWKEVGNPHNLSAISNSLFSSRGSGHDEMWNNASKQFFEDATSVILKSPKPTIKELYKILAIDSLREVAKALKDTGSAAMLDPKNERTAMSIRTNAIAFIEWMKDYKETERKISLGSWFSTLGKEEEKGKWLFLTASPAQRNRLQSFHSMLLDLILNNVMELGVDFNRRLWLVIDELPALKKLPSLPTALSEFRKYGGCIMAGVQSTNQLYEIYGQNLALSMFDQFNTKFIFRTDENNFANYLCKNIGDIEYEETLENYSYGAHEMRDGVSFSKVEKKKPILTLSDLASLKDCEAYVKLPESSVRIAKIKMNYIAG